MNEERKKVTVNFCGIGLLLPEGGHFVRVSGGPEPPELSTPRTEDGEQVQYFYANGGTLEWVVPEE